jgi:hypothetical protein
MHTGVLHFNRADVQKNETQPEHFSVNCIRLTPFHSPPSCIKRTAMWKEKTDRRSRVFLRIRFTQGQDKFKRKRIPYFSGNVNIATWRGQQKCNYARFQFHKLGIALDPSFNMRIIHVVIVAAKTKCSSPRERHAHKPQMTHINAVSVVLVTKAAANTATSVIWLRYRLQYNSKNEEYVTQNEAANQL